MSLSEKAIELYVGEKEIYSIQFQQVCLCFVVKFQKKSQP
ncbi:hypothetical protein NC652_013661 [Populus alba x Populus x berolinensis]|nr:hypothetical protein NC652_013661 [Populus alba x Populus x berolinensis]